MVTIRIGDFAFRCDELRCSAGWNLFQVSFKFLSRYPRLTPELKNLFPPVIIPVADIAVRFNLEPKFVFPKMRLLEYKTEGNKWLKGFTAETTSMEWDCLLAQMQLLNKVMRGG